MIRTFLFFIFLKAFTAFAQPPVDVLHYRFEVTLDDRSDTIIGRATISFLFKGEGGSQLALDMVGGGGKGMKVGLVTEGGRPMAFDQRADRLLVRLEHASGKGEKRTIEISYAGVPKDGLIISKNKFGDRTFFSDHWPNRARHWLPCHDVPDDKASFEFIVTAPSKYCVVSNGLMQEAVEIGAGRKRTHWKEATPLSTKIMAIGVANFAVKTFGDSPAALPISAWVYPRDSAQLFYDYAVAPSIVRFFSGYLGPFPFHKLANVQSTTIFGGMENAGTIFYSETLVSGRRLSEDVIAHEIAHQWFGDMASEKSFTHLWLSEGFATYLTNLYFEGRYGKDSATSRLRKERQEVIAFVAQPRSKAVVDSSLDYMSLLNANSYQKGGWVLHMLRQEVGDTLFQKILRAYYAEFRGGNADTRDFEAVAEKISGRDLRWFFDQWLYRPGVPRIRISLRVNENGGVGKKFSRLRVSLASPQTGEFRYRLELLLWFTDGSGETRELVLDGKGGNRQDWEVRLPEGKVLARVVTDPATKLLAEISVVDGK